MYNFKNTKTEADSSISADIELKTGQFFHVNMNPSHERFTPKIQEVYDAAILIATPFTETPAEVTARIAQEVASTLAQMQGYLEGVTNKIVGSIPMDEKLSWTQKEIDARDFVATGTISAALQAEATITGETVTALSGYIIAKADAYRAIVATVSGWRRKTLVTLSTSTNPQADYDAALIEFATLMLALGITV